MMKHNDGMADLISTLEAIVGQYYHNEQKRGGFFFRYPVTFTRDGVDYECRGGKVPDLTAEELTTLHYKTGANSLYIGAALYQVMDFLERRYKGKLDFTELEVDYQLSQIDLPFPFSDLFNDDDSGLIDDPEDEES